MATICVVGAGRMGSALARAFLRQEYVTHVWNRTPAKGEALADLGAKVAPSLDVAIAASDIIIVNVIDYRAADAYLRLPSTTAALNGKLLVQLTSGSPRQARETGEWATQLGATYLDGAIMATPNIIGEPSATVLYSGAREAFVENKKVFLALGGNAVHVGDDFGHASALDIALLSQLWGTLFGTLQAITVSQAEGIQLDTYAQYLQPFRPVIDGAVEDLVVRVRDGRYRSDHQTLAAIAAHYSAFQHLLEVSAERGLNRAVPDAFDSIFKAAIEAGHLQDDFAALVRFMR
jgi:3-hydroxyisobutyrate dehydrogenase-like beta-hydroxyacid dehydrogenase